MPDDLQQVAASLNWKRYAWGMQSVWLENVLQHQPKRWLPDSYASYDDLLAAAVEAAVSGPEGPTELASWTWGMFHPVEIQHPILGKIPVVQRWTGPGIQPLSGSGYTVKNPSPQTSKSRPNRYKKWRKAKLTPS